MLILSLGGLLSVRLIYIVISTHFNQHLNLTNFECSVCKKRFFRTVSLDDHFEFVKFTMKKLKENIDAKFVFIKPIQGFLSGNVC